MPLKQFDAAIELQLSIMRADAGIRYDVIQLLKKLERELVAKVAAGDYTTWSKARLAKQLSEAQIAIRTYYDQSAGVAIDATTTIAQVSATATAQALSVGAQAGILPTEAILTKLVSNAMIQGAPQNAWWDKQSTDTAWKFQQAVRQGIVAAETNAQIIKRVRTTMDISRRHAASLVQTSVQTISNEARMETFKANDELIASYQFVSALDSHVCPVCGSRDGLRWTTDYEPIDHSLKFDNPPLHVNCRCAVIPITKTWAELGVTGMAETKIGTRASTDGQISAGTTFEQFLDRKGAAFQESVLGKGRAELFRSGKISLSDLTNGNGKPLTLAQLRAKYN
jgi:SPP1 gp7 family putative phage head morphogenesis protein